MDYDNLVLSWKNVTTWSKNSRSKTAVKLLNNVSGVSKSGTLTAVLSPSGAGKTTLLAVLSKRFKGTVEGKILVNGYSIRQKQMSRLSAFVPQKDFAFEKLTVLEHLQFMARLRMDRKLTHEDRLTIITKTVEHLSLSHRLNVQLSALSGGQRKRLTLAVQLLTDPMILLCDEPTTGLDSYSAMSVIKLLRTLADEGKLIICSIHQPASGIFEIFDYVTLLVSGGGQAYHGKVADVKQYFHNIGFDCPLAYNLSEFLVSHVTIRNMQKLTDEDTSEKVSMLTEAYRDSKFYADLMEQLEYYSTQKLTSVRIKSSGNKVDRVRFHVEFSWLLWRTSVLTIRSYKTMALRFFLYMIVVLFVSLPYGKIVINSTGIQNVQGLLHSAMMEILYSSLYGVMLTFPEEMPVFLQESADYVYSPSSYYLSKLIIFLPKCIIESLIYSNIIFYITGLNPEQISLVPYLPFVMVSSVAMSYGFFLSTAFNCVNTASLLSVPFEFISCIFGGIVLRLRSLPWYTEWIKYFSFIYYTYEALSIQQWIRHKHIPCDKDVCYSSGDQVLRTYGFSKTNLIYDYFGLITMFVVFHILGFLFLLRRIKYSAPY